MSNSAGHRVILDSSMRDDLVQLGSIIASAIAANLTFNPRNNDLEPCRTARFKPMMPPSSDVRLECLSSTPRRESEFVSLITNERCSGQQSHAIRRSACFVEKRLYQQSSILSRIGAFGFVEQNSSKCAWWIDSTERDTQFKLDGESIEISARIPSFDSTIPSFSQNMDIFSGTFKELVRIEGDTLEADSPITMNRRRSILNLASLFPSSADAKITTRGRRSAAFLALQNLSDKHLLALARSSPPIHFNVITHRCRFPVPETADWFSVFQSDKVKVNSAIIPFEECKSLHFSTTDREWPNKRAICDDFTRRKFNSRAVEHDIDSQVHLDCRFVKYFLTSHVR
jgi:hypothetical protein